MTLTQRTPHRRARIAIALALVLAPACSCDPPIEPAPEDIKGLAHWLWSNYLTADDAALADAVAKLHGAAGYDSFSEPKRGLLDDLTSDELAPVEMSDRDPRPAQGMYLVDLFDCTLGKLEPILYALDQGAKYSEVYLTFTRTYTSDIEEYKSRATNLATWDMYYEAQPLPAARYGVNTKGSIRYLGADPDVALPHGPVIVQRIYMPTPAHYFDTDANVFDLDFQIELFYEPTPGKVAKFYPFWRHMAFNGVGASTDDNWIIDMVLDGQVDWDVRTAELCAQ